MADPQLPARWRRLYAHVISLEAACPNCGTMTAAVRGKHNRAYDRATAIYQCPVCLGRWYVGVLFWPAKGKRVRPWDHTPTPGEAKQLRELSATTEEELRGVKRTKAENRVRVQVNIGCSCGRCPVHDQSTMEGDDDV